jgi:hypothetical protein
MSNQTPELTTSTTDPVKAQFHKLWGLASAHDYQKSEWKTMQALLDALPLAMSNVHLNREPAKRVVLDEHIGLCPQTITVKAIEIRETDPHTTVYSIEILDGSKGVWMETLNTMNDVRMFLRGIRVATAMAGNTLMMDKVWKFGEESVVEYWP